MSTPVIPLSRRALADAIGTFALVFLGCGAVVVEARSGALGHMGVSLVFGLVVGAMISATGHISGAHFNPAVTLAFAAIGRFPWRDLPAYVAGQLIAATLGALAVQQLIGDAAHLGATLPAVPLLHGMAIEAVLTFMLMFVITAVATDGRAAGQLAAVAIGAAVAMGALMGGPLTGASMNPARTLGPALMSGQFAGLWIYMVGPAIGAVAGAATYRFVACGPATQDEEECC